MTQWKTQRKLIPGIALMRVIKVVHSSPTNSNLFCVFNNFKYTYK